MYYDIVQEKFTKLRAQPSVTVLGIETSCDETAAAVVKDGRVLLSNVISSQIPLHRKFGGVVPEVASRNHTLSINAVIEEALAKAEVSADGIDAVAVTYGAGLIGALLVGVRRTRWESRLSRSIISRRTSRRIISRTPG